MSNKIVFTPQLSTYAHLATELLQGDRKREQFGA